MGVGQDGIWYAEDVVSYPSGGLVIYIKPRSRLEPKEDALISALGTDGRRVTVLIEDASERANVDLLVDGRVEYIGRDGRIVLICK